MRVAGEDAEKLLQGMITNDMELLAAQPAIHAALLTPQGKILFDFFVVKGRRGFLLETAARQGGRPGQAAHPVQAARQGRNRDVSADYRVLALGVHAPSARQTPPAPSAFADPRLPALGLAHPGRRRQRRDRPRRPTASMPRLRTTTPTASRWACPRAARTTRFGDAFPHEADFDQLNGVSFTKGCFVGQEVVSRMQNRANVRKRVVPVEGEAPLDVGAEIKAGAAAIGTVGSVAGRQALALLRLDRAAEAMAKGQALTAGGVAITLRKPDWATLRPRAGRRRGGAMRASRAAELVRCPWVGIADPIYARYHDEEWGVPQGRRPGAVREAGAGGLPGRPVVADDPEEAREFPPRLPRLRRRSASPATAPRTSPA